MDKSNMVFTCRCYNSQSNCYTGKCNNCGFTKLETIPKGIKRIEKTDFTNTIDYLEAEIDSLKDAYKNEPDVEKATVYSSRILEHKKAIEFLKLNQ